MYLEIDNQIYEEVYNKLHNLVEEENPIAISIVEGLSIFGIREDSEKNVTTDGKHFNILYFTIILTIYVMTI